MRRSGLISLAAVVVGVALVGVLNIRGEVKNAVVNSSATGPNAQSSALYCTGLTNARGDVRGVVTFLNTTNVTRHVVVHAVATGARSAVATALTLAPYARQSVTPTNLLVGQTYALSAQIDGGGVSAEQVVTQYGTESPCSSAGVTAWYGSGFDATVNSKAILSVYNPTATAAVFNVTTFSRAGYLAPAQLQGVTVGAHSELALNLGNEIVATSNFGVEVSVLRGSLVIVGDQISHSISSMNYGTDLLATAGTFPLVTTASTAMSQIRVANPSAAAATVKFTVKLAKFKVAPQSATIAPYHSALITITPNTAIPAAGEASLTMTSTQPVDATLATGTVNGLSFSPLGTPASRTVLADVTGAGFGEATATNATDKSTNLSWTLERHGAVTSTGTTAISAGYTVSLGQLLNGRAKLTGATLVLTATTPSLVVNAILNTTPSGVTMAAALDGG